MLADCKHEFMGPYIEERPNTVGRMKRHSIWMCEAYNCGYKEEREYVDIYFSESLEDKKDIDICDDIRVLRIMSTREQTPKQTLELLKKATIDNPIKYQDEGYFWTESSDKK